MSDEIIRLDPAEPGIEATACVVYLAALIYPGSPRKRQRFMSAAFAYGVRVCRHHGMPEPTWASEVLAVVPRRDQGNVLQAAHRALNRRLAAGQAVQSVLLSRGTRSLTNAAKASGYARAYFMHQVWVESLPVLHLAWALLTTATTERDTRPVMLSLIARADWALPAIEQAESKLAFLTSIAGHLPESPFQTYAATDKIRITL